MRGASKPPANPGSRHWPRMRVAFVSFGYEFGISLDWLCGCQGAKPPRLRVVTNGS
jgi:hypothetical protein